jgi:hypothetical protein
MRLRVLAIVGLVAMVVAGAFVAHFVVPSMHLGTSTSSSSISTTVLSGQATTIDLGRGAALIIPPGAMPPGTKVRATYGGEQLGNWKQMKPIAEPVELVSDPPNAIHGLLTLEFPVPTAPAGVDPADLYGVSTFDAATQTWIPFTSTFDRARNKVVALIPHFSWWNPFSWDWVGIAARVNQDVGQVVGRRAGPPTCTSGPPAWVVLLSGVNSDAAVAVRSCAQAQGDVLDVELVNNRPYGMVLQYGAPVKWGWHQNGDSEKDKALYKLADALIGPNQLYLPPLGRASVGIFATLPTPVAQFKIGPSLASLFVDFVDHAADYTLGKIPYVGGCVSLLATYVTDRSPGAIRDNIVSAGDCLLEEYKSQVASGALDTVKVSQLAATLSGMKKAAIVGKYWDIYGTEWQLADLFVDSFVIGNNGGLGAGFSVLAHNTTSLTPPPAGPKPTPPPAPTTGPTSTPMPTPTTVPGQTTYAEQEGHYGANTFTNPYNASGMGPKIPAAAWVQVSCKVYAPAIQSANPDGYWYRIASSPWNNAYYAVANTFMNGDPWGGPYTHNTDYKVPDC